MRISILMGMFGIEIVPIRNTSQKPSSIIVLKLTVVFVQFKVSGLVFIKLDDLIDFVLRFRDVAGRTSPISGNFFYHVSSAGAHRNLCVNLAVPVRITVDNIPCCISGGPFFKAIVIDKAVHVSNLYYLISI